MALERVCWCNGSKGDVDGEAGEVRNGQDVAFYDEMRMRREDWHSHVSARETRTSLYCTP